MTAISSIRRALTDRAVDKDDIVPRINRELWPTVRELLSGFNTIAKFLGNGSADTSIVNDGSGGLTWQKITTTNVSPGTADQVFVTNHGATASQWSSIDLSKSAAVGSSVLAQANVDRTVAAVPIAAPTTLTFSTAAGTVDATAYTVPASPTGTGRFLLTFDIVRLTTAITGGGTVVIRSGTSAGGNDLLVDSTAWTSATALGTQVGVSIADLGTGFTAAAGYVATLSAGAIVSVRATTGGGGISGGAATIYPYGLLVTP